MLLLFYLAVALIQLFVYFFSAFLRSSQFLPCQLFQACWVGSRIQWARFLGTDLKRLKLIFRGNPWSSTESLSGKCWAPLTGLPNRWITVSGLKNLSQGMRACSHMRVRQSSGVAAVATRLQRRVSPPNNPARFLTRILVLKMLILCLTHSKVICKERWNHLEIKIFHTCLVSSFKALQQKRHKNHRQFLSVYKSCSNKGSTTWN